MTQATSLSPRLIPDHERLEFLPKHFGLRLTPRGESLVYRWLERLSASYHGGYWHFYEIRNGFYMVPAGYDQLRIIWPMNDCDLMMSADAAGIMATLYALCELCYQPQGSHLVEQYHALREFALDHVEAAAIFAAID